MHGKSVFHFFSVWILISSLAAGQGMLSGRVTDVKTSTPLEAVNIFLSNTVLGTTTDSSGWFRLSPIPPGRYDLIVSMIGYSVQKEEIKIDSTSYLEFDFKLKQKPIVLPEVTVTARDMRRWRQNYKTFKKSFLGNSANALETEIKNERVLDFERQGETLVATASSPIIIENKALGYRIEYNLEAFEATPDYVKYSGEPLFFELAAENGEQSQHWEKNRLNTYRGSLRHFLRTISQQYLETRAGGFTSRSQFGGPTQSALVGKTQVVTPDRLLREGFRVLLTSEIGPKKKKEDYQWVNTDDLLGVSERQNELYLKFPGYLQVEYLLEKEPGAYLWDMNLHREPGTQVSWLTLQADSIIIDTKGRYYERFMLRTSGYMAWERMADMLPFGYEPPDDAVGEAP